mgnify:CR=1 FL=1
MLEHLFSSKVRIKLLSLFLLNPEQTYFVRELTRRLNERINSIRRELDNLQKLGLLVSHTEDRKKYYTVNRDFELFEELRSLIIKSGVTPQEKSMRMLQSLKNVHVVILTGIFTQQRLPKTDLLVVGSPKREKLLDAVAELEKTVGKQIRYSVIDHNEYDYRRTMHDLFLQDILTNEHITVLDRAAKKKEAKPKNS